MLIEVDGDFITEDYFDETDKKDIKDFFYHYGEQYEWSLLDLSQKAADSFCFRDNFCLRINDECEYLSEAAREQLNDKYYYDLYNSECDAIYNIMSGFEIPKSKKIMDIE